MRDAIVPDDAADLKLPAVVSAKQLARLQRAMLPDVDLFPAPATAHARRPGRPEGRPGRVRQAAPGAWIDGRWTGPGLAPHRLPDDAAAIADFIRQQTRLTDGTVEGEERVQRLLGFSIDDHARITDLLRAGGTAPISLVVASDAVGGVRDI